MSEKTQQNKSPQTELSRELTLFHIVMMGLGMMIGAGVFLGMGAFSTGVSIGVFSGVTIGVFSIGVFLAGVSMVCF